MPSFSTAAPTALALTLALACAPAEEAPEESAPAVQPAPAAPATRATMGRIVDALRVALPHALDAERFADPAHRESIGAALADLAASATLLETHQDLSDPEAGFLSRSMAADADDVAARFDAGRHEEARFLMTLLVDNCIACHSRTPDLESRDLGSRLFEGLDPSALDPHELAHLQVAGRQFDAALATWEARLRDARADPAELARRGLVADYLIVAIRVLDDLKRPRAALDALAARDDTPEVLGQQLRAWSVSLAELAGRPPSDSALDAARALIDEADLRADGSHDAAGLVHEIAASARLHRLLAQSATPNDQRAEAFYLLGLVESRIRQSGWILQAEFYLETAIRTAPGGPHAQAAYDLLEQQILAEYSGSAGTDLPDHLHSRLAGLADLIAGAQPAR